MNQHNFDWSCTNKELVIFVPNFLRKHLLIPTLKRFKTSIPNDRWMWLIASDGHEENMDDLEEQFNLKYFTFEREDKSERNGAFIRNFVIKRLQSRLIATKDPEIIIDGDFVGRVIDLQDVVYRPHKMVELEDCDTGSIISDPFIDLSRLRARRIWEASDKRNQAFHAGCTMMVQRLKDMGGYDERYGFSYGFEDWQMLERLKKCDIPIIIDKEITTYHIAHPIMRKFQKTCVSNERFYKQDLRDLHIIVNSDEQGQFKWGNGIPWEEGASCG